MSQSVHTTLHGAALELLPERAIFWERHKTLLVADPHLGKEATFRRHGIPVPIGSSNGTLQTITRLLGRTQASRLMILGDLFHARSSLSRDICRSLSQFFEEHPSVEVTLVRGNHDAHVGQLPAEWPIEVVEPGLVMDRIALGHHPRSVPDGASMWMCGHLHPAIRLHTREDLRFRVPCFWLERGCLVLPAIGEFTGTHRVKPGAGSRVWVIAENEVIEHHVASPAAR